MTWMWMLWPIVGLIALIVIVGAVTIAALDHRRARREIEMAKRPRPLPAARVVTMPRRGSQ